MTWMKLHNSLLCSRKVKSADEENKSFADPPFNPSHSEAWGGLQIPLWSPQPLSPGFSFTVAISELQFFHFRSKAFLYALRYSWILCLFLSRGVFFFFSPFPSAVRCALQMAQTVPPIVARAQDFTYVKCDLQHFLWSLTTAREL